MKHYFVFNPIAGNKEKRDKFLELYSQLEKKYNVEGSNEEIILYTSKSAGDAINYVNAIALENEGEDICVYACGGDGTTNEVVNGIIGLKNVILGIVPSGSCNDFLKNFKEYDFLDLDRQVNGTIKPVDIIKVDDCYCLNVTNIGFDAKVNYDQIQFRPRFKTIKKAYNHAILTNFLKPLGDYMTIIADDKEVYNGKLLLLAIGNGGYYGGGFNCAAHAVVDDGYVDVIGVKKVSRLTFVRLIKDYKNGTLADNPKWQKVLVQSRCKKVSIKGEDSLVICIDGETIHKKEVNVECIKHYIRFKYPKLD